MLIIGGPPGCILPHSLNLKSRSLKINVTKRPKDNSSWKLVKGADSDYDVKKLTTEATKNFTIGQLQCILAPHWLIFLSS